MPGGLTLGFAMHLVIIINERHCRDGVGNYVDYRPIYNCLAVSGAEQTFQGPVIVTVCEFFLKSITSADKLQMIDRIFSATTSEIKKLVPYGD